MTFPWVDDDVINSMCAGLSQPAAKIRALRRIGLVVQPAANGRPLVLQSHFDDYFNGNHHVRGATEPVTRPRPQPNRAGFKLLHGGKGA